MILYWYEDIEILLESRVQEKTVEQTGRSDGIRRNIIRPLSLVLSALALRSIRIIVHFPSRTVKKSRTDSMERGSGRKGTENTFAVQRR